MRYGFLTTHNLTFFVKNIGLKRYAITNGYANWATAPSVPEILYCECLMPNNNKAIQCSEARRCMLYGVL